MSTSQLVAQHLPFLRRYARALSGSQSAGDAYVTAMLETLIADPSTLDRSIDPRVALYTLLTRLWDSVTLNAQLDAPPAPLQGERRLGHITPVVRQAFLLVSLEGFSERRPRASSPSTYRPCAIWLPMPGANWRRKSPPTC